MLKKQQEKINKAIEKETNMSIDELWRTDSDRLLKLQDKYAKLFYTDLDNNTWYKFREDTVKQGNSWVNKGKEGTHGKFKSKKAADDQRKAMFANGYKG